MARLDTVLRSVLVHAALLAALLSLAIVSDRNGAPCTIACEHQGPSTVCHSSRDSLLQPRHRKLDASEGANLLITGSAPPAWVFFAPRPAILLHGADASTSTLCDSLPPGVRFSEVAVPVEAFLHTDSPALVLTLGSRWLHAPFFIVSVLAGVVWLRLAMITRRRAALAVSATLALALIVVVVALRRWDEDPGQAAAPTDDAAANGALYLRARGIFGHFDGADLHLPAGSRIRLAVAAGRSGLSVAPIQSPIRWSASGGETKLDPLTGVLVVPPDAPGGAVIDVRAEVAGAQRSLVGRIHVYRLDQKPLVGRWRQGAEMQCSGEWTESERIGFLAFTQEGRFRVRAVPLEDAVDYAGTYVYERAGGKLSLRVGDGWHIPAGFVPNGVATIELATPEGSAGDILSLEGIWLGDGRGPAGARPCKSAFSRRSGRRFFERN